MIDSVIDSLLNRGLLGVFSLGLAIALGIGIPQIIKILLQRSDIKSAQSVREKIYKSTDKNSEVIEGLANKLAEVVETIQKVHDSFIIHDKRSIETQRVIFERNALEHISKDLIEIIKHKQENRAKETQVKEYF